MRPRRSVVLAGRGGRQPGRFAAGHSCRPVLPERRTADASGGACPDSALRDLSGPTTPPAMPPTQRQRCGVADSTGLTLYEQAWSGRVPRGAAGGNGYTVEILDFAVAMGPLQDGCPRSKTRSRAARTSSSTSIEALVRFQRGVRPAARASDPAGKPDRHRAHGRRFSQRQQLGDGGRRGDADSAPPRRVLPLGGVRQRAAKKGTITVSVAGANGGAGHQDRARRGYAVDAGKSVFGGKLDLAGLPPEATRSTPTSRSATGPSTARPSSRWLRSGETLASDTARRAEARTTDQGLLRGDEPRAARDGQGAHDLPRRERRAVAVVRQAERRCQAPLPDPVVAEARSDSGYAAEREAGVVLQGGRLRQQRIPRRRTPAILSPAGDPIAAGFMPNTARPDQKYKQQQEGLAPTLTRCGATPAGKGSYYIFSDRSGFGAYSLIYSNDLDEPSLPGWGELLGGPAVQDIGRWLGVDLVAAAQGRVFNRPMICGIAC